MSRAVALSLAQIKPFPIPSVDLTLLSCCLLYSGVHQWAVARLQPSPFFSEQRARPS